MFHSGFVNVVFEKIQNFDRVVFFSEFPQLPAPQLRLLRFLVN